MDKDDLSKKSQVYLKVSAQQKQALMTWNPVLTKSQSLLLSLLEMLWYVGSTRSGILITGEKWCSKIVNDFFLNILGLLEVREIYFFFLQELSKITGFQRL